MEHSEKISAVEALLFFYGEPITAAKVAKVTGFPEKECGALLKSLGDKLAADPERGLWLLEEDGRFQLATKPSLAWLTKKLLEAEFKEELSPAALETLSLIAYLGPVPRSTVDYVRGVNSSFILRNLLIRGLIDRDLQSGKKNIYEYRASFEFLKHMGLGSVKDLPEYEKYQSVLKQFEAEAAAEVSPASASENIPDDQTA
ncbi:SMC-Scp complex subunit ScpB [Patescibacteria group bacterium]|nr:SMC-Scp complex subunit ScpB [Patescibacteria group bacterium]